jgi:hypothetical protein
MSCSCEIEVDHDGGPQFCQEINRKARKEHTCCECHRTITIGEYYEYVSGCWDGYFSKYKTCLDCVSVRKAFFCSYIYTMIWEDLANEFCSYPELPSAECMMMLTKPAKDKVCDLLESYLDEDDND